MKREQERAQLICRMLMGGNASARAQAVEAVERACEAEAELEAAQERERALLDPQTCEKCAAGRCVRMESVDGRGYGWKCHLCGWWTWLVAAQRTEEPSDG